MNYYMVFGSTKRPLMQGGSYLDWGQHPIGVYGGDTADDACKAAASDSGVFGTFFAIDGFVWGLEMLSSEATQLGRTASAADRLNRHLDRLAELEVQKAQLEAGRKTKNRPADYDKVTDPAYVKALEDDVLGDDDADTE